MLTKDLPVLDSYLSVHVPSYSSDKARILSLISLRSSGVTFTLDDYIEGMVRAILTNSVPWSRIAPHIASGRIATIFHHYSATALLKTPYMDIVQDLRSIHCGNRSDIVQMRSLANNIRILQRIISIHGSIENYLRSKCGGIYPVIPYTALNDFNFGGDYKLGGMGIPLVCEFLKNMGYLLPKPDVHLKRFFSGDRMGAIAGHASNRDVFDQISALASTSFPIPLIDLIVWTYCATGYGNICKKVPHCSVCSFYHKNGGHCAKRP